MSNINNIQTLLPFQGFLLQLVFTLELDETLVSVSKQPRNGPKGLVKVSSRSRNLYQRKCWCRLDLERIKMSKFLRFLDFFHCFLNFSCKFPLLGLEKWTRLRSWSCLGLVDPGLV